MSRNSLRISVLSTGTEIRRLSHRNFKAQKSCEYGHRGDNENDDNQRDRDDRCDPGYWKAFDGRGFGFGESRRLWSVGRSAPPPTPPPGSRSGVFPGSGSGGVAVTVYLPRQLPLRVVDDASDWLSVSASFAQNTGKSSGLQLDINVFGPEAHTTTSSSTYVPPAFAI